MAETKRGRQVFRLLCILGILKNKVRSGVTVDELTRLLWDAMGLEPEEKFHARTVRRDLDVLMGKVQWVEKKGSRYYPGQAVLDGLKIGVNFEEALSIYLARHLLEMHEGTPVRTGLDSLWDKFNPLLSPDARNLFDGVKDAFIIKTEPDEGRPDPVTVRQLYLAIERSCTLKLLYQRLFADEAKEGYYDPYGIVYFGGRPYLVADSHYRREKGDQTTISLKVCRIKQLTFTGKTFERPEELDIREKLKNTIGIFVGGEKQKYTIRLNAFAARLVSEEPWHGSQKIEKKGDDEYVLTLEVDNAYELTPKVLALGAHAEVLGPEETRSDIRQTLRTAANSYET